MTMRSTPTSASRSVNSASWNTRSMDSRAQTSRSSTGLIPVFIRTRPAPAFAAPIIASTIAQRSRHSTAMVVPPPLPSATSDAARSSVRRSSCVNVTDRVSSASATRSGYRRAATRRAPATGPYARMPSASRSIEYGLVGSIMPDRATTFTARSRSAAPRCTPARPGVLDVFNRPP